MKKTLLATAALLALTGMAQAQSATPDDDVLELAIRVVPDQDAWQSLLGTTTDPEVFKAALSEKVGTLPGAFILDFNALGGTGNLNFDNG